MSFTGIVQFRENLDTLMESKAFKNASDGKQLEMGYRLLNSRYGLSFFGSVKILYRATKVKLFPQKSNILPFTRKDK